MTVYDRLEAELAALGCRFCVFDVGHIAELKQELMERTAIGEIDRDFYLVNLQRLESSPSMPGTRSVIVIAAPVPLVRLKFEYQGALKPVQIPPYYTFKQKMAAIRKALGSSLGAGGYRIADARIPYKLAAVRCGLARYGRNNLAYVEGMGSFHRLAAFYTDLPSPSVDWFPSRYMEECVDCGFCLGNCHTNCLDPDPRGRFLAYAEKCLTLYNEEPGDFPEWITPWMHNSLIGCMRCQAPCPVNRPFYRDVPVTETFSGSETEAILSTLKFDELPMALKNKLARYDLDDYYELVPRNLKLLLEWVL